MRDSLLFRRSNLRNPGRRVAIWLILKRYGISLFGTSAAFFIYDFVNIPNSIMSSTIINSIVPGHDVRMVAVWQLVLALMSVPGVLVGAWLCNRIGRKWTSIPGFVSYLAFGLIMGCAYDIIKKAIPAYVVVYGLMPSLGHMGPGATIGFMSVESYPTAVRGVGYGISAAFGNTGAAVATACFNLIKDRWGQWWTFIVAAICGCLRVLIYWLCIPEMNGKDLEEEDMTFKDYLQREGWNGQLGDEKERFEEEHRE